MKYGIKKVGLIAGLLLTGLLAMGAAPSIKTYDETFNMAANGAGTVSAQVTLTDVVPGMVEVPLTTWKGMKHIAVAGVPAAIKAEPVLNSDTSYIRLNIPFDMPATLTFTMNFDIPDPQSPAGAKKEEVKERTLKFRFFNSAQPIVKNYRLTILLPEGQVVHSVVEKMPKGKGGDGATTQFIHSNNRHGLVFNAQNLKFGDAATVIFIAVTDKKSPVLLLLLSGSALLYLVAFRDIVKAPVKQKHTDRGQL